MLRFRPMAVAMIVAACSAYPWIGAQTANSTDQAAASEIDPFALSIVQRWVNCEPDAQCFRLWVTDSMDRESEWGQRVLYTHRRQVTAVRPNRLRLQTRGELTNRDLVYDGSQVTVYDQDRNVYAQVPFSGTNREMIEMLLERYDMTTPLADIIGAGRDSFLEGITSAHRIGQARVSGHTCEHVAITRDDLDWQGWFDVGPAPLLWRLVITYKNEPGTPQYVLQLENYTRFPSVPESQFVFTPPEGATLIRFANQPLPRAATEANADPTP
jgi:hypothetical protein